jgi:leucyl-tRNA synthetase
MKRYNPKEIEPKWQKIWEETNVYTADLKSDKPKYIAMSMFNYPSGAGIHIGHAMNYTISDVKARFKRQQGYESYHPIGWDAFGLPAENYAIKAGVSPQESMAMIIPSYHKQYKAMGWSNDWEKEIATHLPEYYKWTQWIFSQMYKHGLAYQDARMQWWCDKCQTVLANEQIIDGKCWRHDGADDPLVEKKEVKQWFFKITEYADELLEATDSLDWTESVKLAQKNWIGRSVGAEVDFEIAGSQDKLTVFTTRPDTLFGATFIVIAPEHEKIQQLTITEQKTDVEAYIQQAAKKSEVERQADKEKTGVFTGSYALNPMTGQKMPIWVAEYVLVGYGTGAVMAVPAHDDRDHEFAKKYNLKITEVVQAPEKSEGCYAGEGPLINSGEYDGMNSSDAREAVVKDLAAKGLGREKVNYKMRDWSVSRQRYWGAPIPIINCQTCGTVPVPDKDLPVILPELTDFKPSGDGRSALARAKDWLQVKCPDCGGDAERETDTLDTYICSSWYMYRYMDPFNQQAIFDSEVVNKWAPIDFYNGGDHATAHLLYARFIARFFSKIGLVENPEPFKHMLFNGKVTASDGSAFSKSKGNGIDPLEIIDSGYGADALRTYLMFAAPLEFSARWDSQGVPGTHRFLSRLWNLTQEYLASNEADKTGVDQQLKSVTHQMIKKVTEDIEANRYNTAIASMMATVNDLYKLKAKELVRCSAWQQALEAVIACVAPFAPHIAEELWQQLGHSSSVHKDSWPELDKAALLTDSVTIVVQVNGKVRGQLTVDSGSSQEDVEQLAREDEKIASYLITGVKKVIFVPNKLISFVV